MLHQPSTGFSGSFEAMAARKKLAAAQAKLQNGRNKNLEKSLELHPKNKQEKHQPCWLDKRTKTPPSKQKKNKVADVVHVYYLCIISEEDK